MTTSVTQATQQPAAATASASRTTLSQNFDTFLTLLTSQLKNQDPLSPIDSNQFTQQLVQYSQVEQQIQTNDTLKQLSTGQKASTAGSALSYLGRTATIKSNAATLADGSADWTYTLDAPSAKTVLSVVDSTGREVFSSTGSGKAGASDFSWDGTLTSGGKAPDGTYRLTVKAVDGAQKAIASSVSVQQVIAGIDLSGADPTLTTASGSYSFGDIVAVK